MGASVTSSQPVPVPASDAAALPALRQNRLAALVRERGQITVAELVTRFGVSRDTIRRDLDALEQRGVLVRTHGGAIPSDSLVTRETSLTQRMDAHVEAKRRIGRAASALIRDGETLIVNGGSTTAYFAAELGTRQNLMVVTNNLRIPPILPERAIRAAYVLGGDVLEQSAGHDRPNRLRLDRAHQRGHGGDRDHGHVCRRLLDCPARGSGGLVQHD